MLNGALKVSLMLMLAMSSLTLSQGSSEAMGDGAWMDHYTVATTKCPPRPQYDAVTVKKMGSEMEKLQSSDPSAASPRFMRDYRTLRQRCDAYEKKQ